MRGRRGGSDAAVARPVLSPSPSPFLGRLNAVFLGGGLEYEETLPVASSKCNYSRLVCVSDRPVFFSRQVLNRRKVSKTSGKIERPCVCAEKVSVFSPPPSSLLPCVGAKGVF